MALLIAGACVPLFVNLASADETINPWDMVFDASPIVTVNSPSNGTTMFADTVLLNLTFTKPYDWVSPEFPASGSNTRQMLEAVGYVLDGKFYGPSTVNSYLEKPFKYYINLTLDPGIHTLQVYGNASGWIVPTTGGPPRETQITGWSDTVSFTTFPATPAIDVQPPKVNGTSVSLSFTLDEPVSQISYRLDNQENVSVLGNTTLTALPYGRHNVTVYATNQVGNVGASETVAFTITEPSEPFPVVTVAVAIVVVVGLLVYFKRRKR